MDEPRIFRGYGRSELDRQYNNRRRFPGHEEDFGVWREWSAAAPKLRANIDLA